MYKQPGTGTQAVGTRVPEKAEAHPLPFYLAVSCAMHRWLSCMTPE